MHIWKNKIPPKEKLLAWFVIHNAIPIVDNLNKRDCQIETTTCILLGYSLGSMLVY